MVEGELGAGVTSDKTTVSGVDIKAKIQNQEAIYAVGFLPLNSQWDLLARIGYGTTKVRAKALGVSDSASQDSVNYGVGAQHLFDGMNGIRADYTYQDFTHSQGHANVWTVGYVRKF